MKKNRIIAVLVWTIIFAGTPSFAQTDNTSAAPTDNNSSYPKNTTIKRQGNKLIVVPENQDISFEGMNIEGELKSPGEFYFQNRPEEKFDSLTKRRPNFRREMMRDAVVSQ